MLYMRVDVVMLQQMIGPDPVGVYAAATPLSEVWYMLPTIIVASAAPAILRAHAADRRLFLSRLQHLYFALAWTAIGIALPLSLAANTLITFLYGAAFAAAGPVLAVHL